MRKNRIMTSVLLVDDNINLVKSMSLILRHKGYDVDIAPNGFEAIDKVRKKSFDMIFLDIKMPYIDGVETYKKIKAIIPDAVVMMMTAYSVEEMIEEALEEGAYGILYKPLNVEDVILHIKKATEDNKGGLILVVDDDLGTSNTLKKILSNKGYSVAICGDGDTAIELAKENNFKILFIDIKLPTINGLETYMAIKAIKPETIAIMMTGYRYEVSDIVAEALSKSAYTCLYKPLQMANILQMIEKILGRKKNANS